MEGRNRRWVVPWQWIFLVTLSFVLSSGVGSAQSLVEVAKKEKERRAQVNPEGESYVITERDLRPSYGRLPASGQSEGEGETSADEAQAEDEEGEDETKTREYWQTRVQGARQKIQELEERLESDEMNWGGGMRTDVNPVGQRNLTRRQDVETQLAQARTELQAIQAEGRRAGVPPGWVR